MMNQVLNLLPAEIPEICGKSDLRLFGKRKLPAGMHFHAERGLFALIRHGIRRIKQFAEQRGFACARLADNQHFRGIKRNCALFLLLLKIAANCINTFFDNIGRWGGDWVSI